MYDIIIIGAGPSGLTSAIYGKRAAKRVLVLESNACGGQILNASNIENYPAIPNISGFDFSNNLYNQAKDLGAEIVFEQAIHIKDLGKIKEVSTTTNIYKSKTVIISTGLKRRKLGLENEDEFVGRGVSYCATCDGAFFKNKIVLVVGGGNIALEDALYLSDIAKKVYLVHRKDKFKAEETTILKLKEKKNIEILLNSTVEKINALSEVNSILIKDIEGNERTIKIDGLFIAIGHNPETEIFSNTLDINKDGFIKTDNDCHTNIDGIFASGDCREKSVRQLVTATNDGAISAIEAIKYINNLDE